MKTWCIVENLITPSLLPRYFICFHDSSVKAASFGYRIIVKGINSEVAAEQLKYKLRLGGNREAN